MVAYVISLSNIADEAAFEVYAAEARRLRDGSPDSGRIIARGKATALEGNDAPDRALVIEFESAAAAAAFYNSPAYAAARKLREGAGEVRLIVVDGFPPA